MTVTDRPTDLRRARRVFLLVGIALPLLVTAVGVALMIAWMPQLPDPIALHWNAAGQADGFGAAWIAPLLTAGLGILFAGIAGLSVLGAAREGEWGPTMRFLGAMSAGATSFLVVLVTWSVAMQRGLDDARDAPSIVPALVVGAVIGLAIGAGAWFVQPALTVSGGRTSPVREAERIVLAPGERAVWLRTTTLRAGAMATIIGATVVLALLALWAALTGVALWPLFAATAVLFLVLLLTTSVFRVRVDDEGLRVRAPVGVPRFGIPLEDVAQVEVARVTPMVDFGGWGIRRSIDGRTGIVLHAGDGIQITRRDGRRFVVTVDDAATGAALLTALRARSLHHQNPRDQKEHTS